MAKERERGLCCEAPLLKSLAGYKNSRKTRIDGKRLLYKETRAEPSKLVMPEKWQGRMFSFICRGGEQTARLLSHLQRAQFQGEVKQD